MTGRLPGMRRRAWLRWLSIVGGIGPGSRALRGQAGERRDPPTTGVAYARHEGQHVIVGARQASVHIKVDVQSIPAARMGMITEDLRPGSELGVHRHEKEDEILFIHRGTGLATLADRLIPVHEGATLYIPQGVWHGLRNTGRVPLTLCAIFSPPGFEQLFKEVGAPPGEQPPSLTAQAVARISKKYGLTVKE